MRSEVEIRAAIDTLERAIVHLPYGIDSATMAGEIAGLRYALDRERARPSLADTLPKLVELIAEFDAQHAGA